VVQKVPCNKAVRRQDIFQGKGRGRTT